MGQKLTWGERTQSSANDPKQTEWPALPCQLFGNDCNVCRIEMISTMRAARPTTGSALSVFEAGAAPFDPAGSCFRPFCPNSIQQIHSLRARGVMASHVSNAFASEVSALFEVFWQVVDHTA